MRPDGPETGQKEDVYEKLWTVTMKFFQIYGQSFVSTWNTNSPKAHLICQGGMFLKSETSHRMISHCFVQSL